MEFVAATASYESWLNDHITIVAKDLEYKHKIMADNEFVFFRATYYRWLQQLPAVAPVLDGPIVACVGDLHMENFGTWQSAGGHLAWGVNDFDESEELPYAYDLARLATSASLAIADPHLHRRVDIDPTAAHDAILRGYTTQLARGGRPFRLDGHHRRRLTRLIHEALPDDGNSAGPPALPRHRRAVRGHSRCRRRRHRAHHRVNVRITPTPGTSTAPPMPDLSRSPWPSRTSSPCARRASRNR